MSSNGNGNLATCLVIDDEPAILRLVAVILEDLGCEALTAPDAESGLKVMEKKGPDFVISDVKLPGMDGLELARRIKSDDKLEKTPVLLMSAFGEPRNHPGDGFLAKPFDIDSLVDFVSPYLDAHE
jgi:CheY-like chemotaxis protein